MALIAQSSIQAVIDACDMIEVVAPYSTLKKSGANYMGRCPFHGEKTPSFSVDPGQKLYYCFGCGEGGNVFTFIEKKEGLDFADAVKMLADKYGVRLQYEASSPEQENRRQERERLLALLDQAATYYSRCLLESSQAAPARQYLGNRGFKEPVIREFRLGFSPAGGSALLKAATGKGFTETELSRAGLIIQRDASSRDRFRGRLMFPFTDHRGRVLGFGARVLDDSKPKYLNSPDSELYHKTNLVFGLGNARTMITKEDRVFIVEGYTDVLALHQAGIVNAVASMGTALTEQQLKEISRFTRNVYLAFDADAAGQAAMLRALELAKKHNLAVRVVKMPPGQDPAELVLSEDGLRSFNELGSAAPTLLEYQVQTTLSSSGIDSSQGRVRAFASLKNVLDGAASSMERDEQLRIIADRLRLSPENVAYLMKSAPSNDDNEDGGTRRRVLTHEEIAERSFLSLCLANPGEARRYLQLMTEAHFTNEQTRAAFIWVREKLDEKNSGSGNNEQRLVMDRNAREILPELLIRSRTGSTPPEALTEYYFRLCEAELSRRISVIKATVSEGKDTGSELRELYRLETRRRDIIRLIQSGSCETV
ncbi:MAG: DNA primase [Thermoleophilia bacterium]|nr:DNA primase [Thermoleophilia bacterium]